MQALQRNFSVLSKLCQSEQEEKQKLLEQSQSFKRELDEKVDTVCRLFDEVDQLKKQVAEMKSKVNGADKAAFEL